MILEDRIEIVAEICCSLCGRLDTEYTSDIELAAKGMAKNGWHIVDDKAYCGKCRLTESISNPSPRKDI